MDGNKLQKTAQARAESLPEATSEHPFGPEREVYKVHGKVFMLLTEVPSHQPVVILKAELQEAEALRAGHTDITLGYYRNKKHWITLAPRRLDRPGPGHRLIVAGLPKTKQPVDPKTFDVRAPGAQ